MRIIILLFMCVHITSYAMQGTVPKIKPKLVLLFLKLSPLKINFSFFDITEQTTLKEVIERLHSHFVSGVPLENMNYIITPMEAHEAVKTFDLERWGSKKIIPIIKLCQSEMFCVEKMAQLTYSMPEVPSLDLSKLPSKK